MGIAVMSGILNCFAFPTNLTCNLAYAMNMHYTAKNNTLLPKNTQKELHEHFHY